MEVKLRDGLGMETEEAAAPKQRFAKSKQPHSAVLDAWDDDDPWLEKASPTIGKPGKLSTSSSEDERVTVPKMARITPAAHDETTPAMAEGDAKPVGVDAAGVVKAAAVKAAVEATEAKGAAIEEAKEKAQQCTKAISEARMAAFAATQMATAYASLLAFEPPLEPPQKTD